jgi:hypothetical protein
MDFEVQALREPGVQRRLVEVDRGHRRAVKVDVVPGGGRSASRSGRRTKVPGSNLVTFQRAAGHLLTPEGKNFLPKGLFFQLVFNPGGLT